MTLLKGNELLEKLTQIHEQAELTLDELPKGLAKYLKTAVELGDEPSNPGG